VYVSGIKDTLTEDDLRQYFSKFGNVENVDIAIDKISGQRRGFAFVAFEDYDPVDKIVCEYLAIVFFCLLFTEWLSRQGD